MNKEENPRKQTDPKRLEDAWAEAEKSARRAATLHQILGSGSWSVLFDPNRVVTGAVISPECRAVVQNDVGDSGEWMALIHPDDRDRTAAAFNDALLDVSGQTPYDIEYRFRARTGEYLWIHAAGRILLNADNSGEFYGCCVDITETVRRHEKDMNDLLEEKTRSGLLEDFISAGQWCFGLAADDSIVSVDYAYDVKKALASDRVTDPHAWEDLVHPDDRAAVVSAFAAAIADHSGKTPSDVIHRMVDRDGNYSWYRSVGRVMRHADGSGEFVGIQMNVSESVRQGQLLQMQNEREIRAGQAKDRQLASVIWALYGYNITVDLKTGGFSLISGTGTESVVKIMRRAKNYRELFERMLRQVRPGYHDMLRELVSLDRLRMNRDAGGTFRSGRYQLVGDEETAHWGEVTVFFMTDENGNPAANVLGRDVTEECRAAARHERERKQAQAKDQMLAGITQALYGLDLAIDVVRDTFTVIRGAGQDAVCEIFESCLGQSYSAAVDAFLRQVPRDGRNEVLRILGRDVLLGQRSRRGHFETQEFAWRDASGRTRWCRMHGFMAVGERGEPIANILGRDVTAAHEESERRDRASREAAAKDMILSNITKSIYGYILRVNLETLGCSVIRGTGMDCHVAAMERVRSYTDVMADFEQRVPKDDLERATALLSPEAMRAQAAQVGSGHVGSVEYEFVCPIRGSRWHLANVFIGRDENGVPTGNILVRDVTEQHAFADAEAKLKVAEEASKAKSDFLFNVSHDVRTPMHAIMGFADIAARDLDNRDTVKDCLAKIRKSGDLLFSLLNSVLDVSRIEAGKLKLVETVGDVRNSFESVSSTMKEIAREKSISLEFAFGDIPDRYVYIDQEKCSRIFVNIISNAIKYTKDGGRVRVSCEQAKPAADGRAWYRYTFADNGIGMSPEYLKNLYQRFSREEDTTVTGVSGLGLGMTICKAFVDQMGGTIDCQSQKGVGTTFTVLLPFRLQEGKHEYVDPLTGKIMDADRPEPEMEISFKGRRVLLVDDSKLNREVSKYYLVKAGFDVETAEDGTLAVGLVRKRGPGYYDVILMDIQMLTMSGLEATRQIRKWEGELKARFEAEQRDARSPTPVSAFGYKPVPIIALSANAFEEDRAAALAAGMNDHLAKGLKPAAFLDGIGKNLWPKE
jgi:signal transduction histidine kinase/CheY-like chemotaxis protein